MFPPARLPQRYRSGRFHALRLLRFLDAPRRQPPRELRAFLADRDKPQQLRVLRRDGVPLLALSPHAGNLRDQRVREQVLRARLLRFLLREALLLPLLRSRQRRTRLLLRLLPRRIHLLPRPRRRKRGLEFPHVSLPQVVRKVLRAVLR